MGNAMVERIYLEDGQKQIYICPECQRENTLDDSSISPQENGTGVKIECQCGFVKMVYFENRNFGRLQTNLPGTFNITDASGKPQTGLLVVKDLSMTGLKLQLSTSEISRFKIGDQLEVEFHLDDESRSHIRKKVTLKYIENHFCGVQFCSEDEYDNHLVTYYFIKKGFPSHR